MQSAQYRQRACEPVNGVGRSSQCWINRGSEDQEKLNEKSNAKSSRAIFSWQEEAVLRALNTYRPNTLVCVGVDFGHTSPQWVLPYGGQLTVDGPARRLVAQY